MKIYFHFQVARITECGRMLMAIELSNWLNDVPYALQSVVYCYGLIAPLIYHKIPSEPAIQVKVVLRISCCVITI